MLNYVRYFRLSLEFLLVVFVLDRMYSLAAFTAALLALAVYVVKKAGCYADIYHEIRIVEYEPETRKPLECPQCAKSVTRLLMSILWL
ncbi:MAG: hypothetical protein ACE5KD_03590 [Candidatus Bathyarchaeia archaeon]